MPRFTCKCKDLIKSIERIIMQKKENKIDNNAYGGIVSSLLSDCIKFCKICVYCRTLDNFLYHALLCQESLPMILVFDSNNSVPCYVFNVNV